MRNPKNRIILIAFCWFTVITLRSFVSLQKGRCNHTEYAIVICMVIIFPDIVVFINRLGLKKGNDKMKHNKL